MAAGDEEDLGPEPVTAAWQDGDEGGIDMFGELRTSGSHLRRLEIARARVESA
jgi:hypothetical protein